MDFQLSQEQEEIRSYISQFARRFIMPRRQECDEKEEFPHDVLERAFEAGILNGYIPKEYGGLGWGPVEVVLAAEEYASACCGVALSFMGHFLSLRPIILKGTKSQQEEFLRPMTGAVGLASFAITEPDTGQDVRSMRTAAERKNGGYILTGSKQFITNAPYARFFVVLARTGKPGFCTMFIVPSDATGVTVGIPDKKMGVRASHSAEVFFDSVDIPDEHRLGEEGEGYELAFRSLDLSRTALGAIGVGVARAAMEEAIRTGRDRKRWGTKLLFHEHYMMRLGQMEAEIRCARLAVWHSAWKLSQNMTNRSEACVAKMMGADVGMRVTTEAVEMLGGLGYMREVGVEKLMRDAKLLQIVEGPTTMQRLLIAKEILT